MSPEDRIISLNLELPAPPPPGGIYTPLVYQESLIYVSGHGPNLVDGTQICGKVGGDLTMEEGYQAARQVGLTMLATLQAQLGSLNRIKRAIKVLGMVNATPEFGEHPQVINGFSQLLLDVFGENNGRAARSAVGMGSLPGNIAVEVEAIFELHEG
ncbi:Endoribonuclease L-PSP [Polystyrenella longa]|uniref:Endoribonuclease L-PSP n=1 Tax=Polystyrenella longa TaxID=2528007 RepID=A0A518CHJ4_9PLAN|nr:RidA family protein [Polystyrenella longa]QDU78690.1 Endoribonuclease L-PSP [Polystyrenella longa]